jgi:hypothetical protein
VEQSSEFFVSKPARADYFGPPRLSAGTAGLDLLLQTNEQRCGRGTKAARGRVLSSKEDGAVAPQKKKKRGPGDGVGQALRSAYERTLEEDIPPEMLDLLGKLG